MVVMKIFNRIGIVISEEVTRIIMKNKERFRVMGCDGSADSLNFIFLPILKGKFFMEGKET